MATHAARAPQRIASGQTDSPGISNHWGANPAKVALDHATSVTIIAPAALTGVCNPQIDGGNGTFVTLQSAGADVTLPAGKATVLPRFTAVDLRIHSAGAEGANRDFIVSIQEEIP